MYEYNHNGMMENPTVVDKKGHKIADVYSSDKDAMLFASAPELLDVLKELVDLMEAIRLMEYIPDSFTTQPAKIAIAKAEGTQ